jgi:penicillin-binding protein 2
MSVSARRGNIYDANMEELATSKPIFSVAILSYELEDREKVARTLAAGLNDPDITAESIIDSIKAQTKRYEPIVVKRYLYEDGLNIITHIEEMRDELPGGYLLEEPARYYPNGSLLGHVLGTVGLISENELEEFADYDYGVSDWIGKTGIEKSMEHYMNENGVEMV